MSGINRAKSKHVLNKSSQHLFESISESLSKPCIFLSHISIDKKSAIEIGKYITDNTDIDIYLDIYDKDLQTAVDRGDAEATTRYIQEGIHHSTHMLCLISNDTKNSWWVPYELGYGKCASKEVASLTLKGVSYLPEYLTSELIIEGTKSLNEYLKAVTSSHNQEKRNNMLFESTIPYYKSNHPLDPVLSYLK